ncbi:bromodomain-containing protein DDB_G0280777 [Drosophila nasuta]|uniref:bromodomain-containing protein DDB_G0280777 n=1 Tax=Drosophila nasuta TaxID=42062 RepID=UPI00295ED68B|nr:bromodomain-containing protein DDB_G0280777 [Drosophila nasuta]
MKQFAVLVCLSCAVLAAAAPQGYNYNKQQQAAPVIQTGNLRPQTPVSTSGIYNVPAQQQPQQQVIQTVSPPVQTVVNTVEPQVQLQVQHQVQSQPQQPQQQIIYQAPQQPQVIQQPQQQFVQTIQQPQQQFVQTIQQPQQQFVQSQYVQRPAIVTKDIYIHSAPDDTEEITRDAPQLDNLPIRKNYRIVFIKAPTQNLKHTAAALKRAQASNEEKTVIYVLSKKPDITEIQQHLQLSQTESKVHKPEVYFIKYKTTEEAQRAQQEIQAQYDALGGATHISDEGVAPITSFSGGSLNIGSIVPQHVQTQTIAQQPQTQTIVQTTPIVSQNVQQQGSFVQQSGLQSSTVTSGVNFGVNQPLKRYVPAKTFK